jgi:predicted regulator of Ras-like GTPase activity (Roadblock/LC7/MglB family)
LAFTTLSDVLQFLHSTGRTGELLVQGGPNGHEARVFFENGNAYHAEGHGVEGIETLVEVISWVEGGFRFSADDHSTKVTIEVPLPNALVEAARLLDERQRTQDERERENAPQRLLTAFTESSGVFAAMLMARNGAVIASASSGHEVDTGPLGGSLASLIETIDRLGDDQGCQPFGGFFVEFDRFQILCLPLASTVLIVVAPGHAQLGVIRHKTQQLADALAKVLIN